MYLCIDIGGTKTLIALLGSDRKIQHSLRFPTPDDQNLWKSTLTTKIRDHFNLTGLKAISIAIPGPTANNQFLWLGNLPWQPFPLATELQNTYKAPAFLKNDASLAALAEAENLLGTTVYLTFSTGIGGGIVKNRQITPVSDSFEPGHVKYSYQNVTKEWEDLASAAAIRQLFNKKTTQITNPADWTEVAHRIALGLPDIITAHHPDRIIFGGPLGLALPHYWEPLKNHLKPPLPEFSPAKYQHESVIYGCLLYAQQQLTSH